MNPFSRSTTKRLPRKTSLPSLENLESRALLATTSTAAVATGFVAPDLSGYIYQAVHNHRNTGPAVIRVMENALQSQLNTGVLTALQGGTLTTTDFSTSVNNVVASYETNVTSQLSPRFPNITNILLSQAQAVLSVENSLNLQLTDGLITQSQYTTEAAQVVGAITGGPLYSLNTRGAGYASATTTLETQLNLLPAALASGASPSLTLAQAQAISTADVEAYRSAVSAALYGRPNITSQVNTALNTYEASVAAITTTGTTTPAQQFTAAITTLDTTLLGTNGLFAANGRLRRGGF